MKKTATVYFGNHLGNEFGDEATRHQSFQRGMSFLETFPGVDICAPLPGMCAVRIEATEDVAHRLQDALGDLGFGKLSLSKKMYSY